MKTLHVHVADKIATYHKRDGDIICGNSDYQVEFTFDSEWQGHNDKTARFKYNGKYTDVDFSGTTCPVPILTNTTKVKVGVYAGDLNTTTAAVIHCKPSILCGDATPSAENNQNYVNEAKEQADRAELAAVRAESVVERTEELLNAYITEVDTLIGGDS